MFITAVYVLIFIKLRWPKDKSLYDTKQGTYALLALHQISSRCLCLMFIMLVSNVKNSPYTKALGDNNYFD